MVEPYPLLFFGGKVQSYEEDGVNVIAMDGLAKFHAPARIAQLVQVCTPTRAKQYSMNNLLYMEND